MLYKMKQAYPNTAAVSNYCCTKTNGVTALGVRQNKQERIPGILD